MVCLRNMCMDTLHKGDDDDDDDDYDNNNNNNSIIVDWRDEATAKWPIKETEQTNKQTKIKKGNRLDTYETESKNTRMVK